MNRREKNRQPRLAAAALIPWTDGDVRAAFFGRAGGVSRGPYRSLNLAANCGDNPEAVASNWRRVREFLEPCTGVVRLRQVHGAEVHRVEPDAAISTTDRGHSQEPRGDGLVTARTGVALAILTADCVPILLRDPHRRAIGALHAGWRGALAGIAQRGVRELVALGARLHHIRAALGPAIGQCCFEIDQELADRFATETVGAASHIEPGRPGKARLNLKGLLRDQLLEAGLLADAIMDCGPCTKCAYGQYFSRRAAHGRPTGLQASIIAIAP